MESAKQSVQCMYSGVCNDGMYRHSGEEKQTPAGRHLFVYDYGVGVSSGIWHVSFKRQWLCRYISG